MALIWHLFRSTSKSLVPPASFPSTERCSVPPNVQFQIDDLEESWTFSFNFDYIHVLMMTGAFRDWPAFYRQAFQ